MIAADIHTSRAPRVLPCLAAERQEGLQSLFGRQPVERFGAGTAVFWEGDPALDVFEVTGGTLRIFRILADGRRIITGFVHAGDLLGLSLNERYRYTAEAITEVTLRRIARSRFQQMVDASPDLRPQLLARLCDEMAAAQDQMVLLARKSAEERVCSMLLMLARRAGGRERHPVVDLPMTRLDMADYLGLTIETVSRIMARLTGTGVIAASGRHAVQIRRPARLAVLAGEEAAEDSPPAAGAYVRQAVWPQ